MDISLQGILNNVNLMTWVWAIWTCIWALWALFFWYQQVKLNRQLIESQCIWELMCYWDVRRHPTENKNTYKFQFQVKWNSPVDLISIILWNQYMNVNHTLLWEDIVYGIEILNPWTWSIVVLYKDILWQHYQREFSEKIPHQYTLWTHVLNSWFKKKISKYDYIKILKNKKKID